MLQAKLAGIVRFRWTKETKVPLWEGLRSRRLRHAEMHLQRKDCCRNPDGYTSRSISILIPRRLVSDPRHDKPLSNDQDVWHRWQACTKSSLFGLMGLGKLARLRVCIWCNVSACASAVQLASIKVQELSLRLSSGQFGIYRNARDSRLLLFYSFLVALIVGFV